MRRQLLLALAIVAGLAWAVPLKAADVRGFDILGIKLGMTVDEVKTQAKAKGFDDVKRSLAPSFEQAVALENREQVQARDYNGTLRARFGGDSEKVEVFFTQTPGGSQAARISYRFFGPGVTIDQMTAQALVRYGGANS